MPSQSISPLLFTNGAWELNEAFRLGGYGTVLGHGLASLAVAFLIYSFREPLMRRDRKRTISATFWGYFLGLVVYGGGWRVYAVANNLDLTRTLGGDSVFLVASAVVVACFLGPLVIWVGLKRLRRLRFIIEEEDKKPSERKAEPEP